MVPFHAIADIAFPASDRSAFLESFDAILPIAFEGFAVAIPPPSAVSTSQKGSPQVQQALRCKAELEAAKKANGRAPTKVSSINIFANEEHPISY